MTDNPRTLAWFSCGTPSAVNAKLSVEKYDAEVLYCNTFAEEHPDNKRFFKEVEKWIGRKIKVISSKEFKSPTEVFEKRRYMSGIAGAPCTVALKKMPRFDYQRVDDIHTWGYHIGEEDRIINFEKNNPELYNIYPLIDDGLTKTNCKEIIYKAGIEEPAAYKLGLDHNNCWGCVKATSPKYWNRVRQHAPEIFESRAKLSREIGCRLVRVEGERIFLDELSPSCQQDILEDISCGPQCV